MSRPTDQAVEAFKGSSVSSKIFLPSSDYYEESLKSYWTSQETSLRPRAIFRPTTTSDVAEIVRILTHVNVATHYKCPFAIRAGGHQPWPGSANISEGLTIDLRGLKAISLNANKSLVTLGAGNLWINVYETLAKSNLMVSGGRASHVGVAGLVLGGGLSYFSPREGMVCDTAVDFEIVLSGGTVTHANDTTNSDLFKALKGGSNNFGIVTNITLKTIPGAKIWGGRILYDFEVIPQMLEVLSDAMAQPDTVFDRSGAVFVAASFHYEFGFVGLNSLKYTQPVESPEFLERFVPAPQRTRQNTLRLDFLSAMVEEESLRAEHGFRRLFYTISCRNDPNTLHSFLEIWQAYANRMKDVEGILWTLIFNPILPPRNDARSTKQFGNCLGLQRFGAFMSIALAATWNNQDDDTNIICTAKQLFADLECDARRRNTYVPFIYQNYAWDGQSVLEGYGQENRNHLEAMSRKYDPEGIFQKAVPGGFKIFASSQSDG